MFARNLLATMVFAIGLSGPEFAVQAQNTEASGTFRDWSYFVIAEPRECLVASAPRSWTVTQNGETVSAQRGDIRFYISILPGENTTGVPSFGAGYPLAQSEQVEMKIDGTTFYLLPNANTDTGFAWAQAEDDSRIIAAMQGGAEATIIGQSARGKVTTDNFSLFGFTAAYKKAQELCQ